MLQEYYAQYDVGQTVIFGQYEQDADGSNGEEEIEWLVLAREDDKALLISKYALDSKPFNSVNKKAVWENCTLRNWLNETFLNIAFSEEDQKHILISTVAADANPDFTIDPGEDTEDMVFLLSIREANAYFSSITARQCKPTAFAIEQGCDVNEENGNCSWWLRSPGDRQDYAAGVLSFGSVYNSGKYVTYSNYAVRPAMWISIDF